MNRIGWTRLMLVAGLFVAGAAYAEKAVVLEFPGDRKGKLRAQIERAIRQAGRIQVYSIEKYKKAALKKKLKGHRAMTPAGVSQVAPGLGIDVALEGAVTDAFHVRILDQNGQELWSRELQMIVTVKAAPTPSQARTRRLPPPTL